MKYSDLKHVLDENRGIFRQIAEHGRGGPVPKFEGLPLAAASALDSDEGRAASRELMATLQPLRTEFQNWDQWESLESKKRPEEALRSHVGVSSQFIAAYVDRAMFLAREKG